jgi:hypothetical protein
VRTSSAESLDVVALWKRVSAKFDAMTPKEKAQTYVTAGILTKKGNVRKPYRNVIVPIKPKTKAN